MSSHRWLDALHGDLVRRGLPAPYAVRFVQELDDHWQDLFQEQEDGMTTGIMAEMIEKRLGSPEELADSAVAQFRAASFAGRHPVLTFVLAPIPAVTAGWALFFLTAYFVSLGLDALLGYGARSIHTPESELPAALDQALRAVLLLGAFLPPAVVAFLWYRLFRRSGRWWLWGLASCLLVAVAAGLYYSHLTFPTATERGSLTLGFSNVGSAQQFVQFSVPLGVAGLCALWTRRASRTREIRTEQEHA
jgi:hypothetical protein